MHSDSDRNFASFSPVSGSDFDVATGEMRASLPDRSLEREWRVLPGAVSDALVPERLELVDGCRKFVRLCSHPAPPVYVGFRRKPTRPLSVALYEKPCEKR